MRLSELEYALPPELIAQEPAPERARARLLVLAREGGSLQHAHIADLPRLLRPGDLLVLNDTRVIPARLHGRRPSGGRLEVFLVRPVDPGGPSSARPLRGLRASDAPGPRPPARRLSARASLCSALSIQTWEVLVRGTARAGELVHFPDALGEWVTPVGAGRWWLRLETPKPVLAWLEDAGEVPLPSYIRRPGGPEAADRERYQTVFARVPGAVAAPTAGLHFTRALLAELERAGIEHTFLTLHVGPGTFLPIRTDDVDGHHMLPERYVLSVEAAARIVSARAAGRRVVTVGTTCVRALESAARDGELRPGAGEAELFIRPGHPFRMVDALLTNFHLPRTPLLALVAAFARWEQIRAAYEEAVRQRYSFYSFGDAMLIT